jgi:hypothetical protein
MASWPKAEGVVRRAWVHVRPGRATSYAPRFEVAFTHEGRSVTAEMGSPTRAAYRERRGADQDVARCPPGATVPVFVNPADPAASFLKRPEPHIIAFQAVGAFALLAAAALFVVGEVGPGDEELHMALVFLGLGVLLAAAAVAAAVALLKK